MLTKLESLGAIRIFSKEAYRGHYGKDPSEDGVFAESFTSPTGQQMQVYKAGVQGQVFTEADNHLSEQSFHPANFTAVGSSSA